MTCLATPLDASSAAGFTARFEAEYVKTFGMTIPGMSVEVMSWALRLAAASPPVALLPAAPAAYAATPASYRDLYNPETGGFESVPLYGRLDLRPGATIHGPAIIAEDETSTLVARRYNASINALGYIVLQRKT